MPCEDGDDGSDRRHQQQQQQRDTENIVVDYNNRLSRDIELELLEDVGSREGKLDPLIFRRCSRSRLVVFGFFDNDTDTTDDGRLLSSVASHSRGREPPSLPLLSAQRVNQMTKVYYDVDSTTLLLEERERDLELAARIGQNLLERNHDLNNRNEALESKLSTLNDIVAQLHHKLELKSDLLAFYTQALDSVDEEDQFRNGLFDDSSSPHGSLSASSSLRQSGRHNNFDINGTPRFLNESLLSRESASCSVSVQVDNPESGLLQTCLKQLAFLSDDVERLTSEVATKTAEVIRQQNEIETLTEQLFSLQSKLSQSDDENARMGERLEAAKDAQSILAGEVGGLKTRYDECLDLLREAQQEIRALKKRQRSCRPIVHYFNSSACPSTARGGQDAAPTTTTPSAKDSNSTPTRIRAATAPNSLLMTALETPCNSNVPLNDHLSTTCSCRSIRRVSSDCDSDAGYAADSDSMLESLICSPNPSSSLCCPRTLSPGLTSRTSVSPPENSNKSSDALKVRSCFQQAARSPVMSRLRIVKPLEGSATMHRWQCLAHPTLSSSALDSLPGVLAKEHDPVADVSLHRRNRDVAIGGASSDGALSVPSISVNNSEFDTDVTDDDSNAEMPLSSRLSRQTTMYLLDDEEELYGDFEVVEARVVTAVKNLSDAVTIDTSNRNHSPSLRHQLTQDVCDHSSCDHDSNSVCFDRLAGIHRNKGHQGLNLSPPNKANNTLLTRSVTLEQVIEPTGPQQSQPTSPPPASADDNSSGISSLDGDKHQQQPKAVLAFYHPSAAVCEGSTPSFSFASSFLPKYRQFLQKHNINTTSFTSTTSSTMDEVDEECEELES